MIPKSADLGTAQHASLALPQLPQLEGTDAQTGELHDPVTELGARPPNLSIATFPQHDPEDRHVPLRIVASGRYLGWRRPAVANVHAAREISESASRDRPADRHTVLLVAPPRGMEHAMREIPVVGEEHQTVRIPIESADGGEPAPQCSGRQKPDHGGSALRVAARGDDSRRLVDQPVFDGFCSNPLAVDGDPVGRRIGGIPECGDPAIHRNAALSKERFTVTPRCDPRAGQQLLQTYPHAGELAGSWLVRVRYRIAPARRVTLLVQLGRSFFGGLGGGQRFCGTHGGSVLGPRCSAERLVVAVQLFPHQLLDVPEAR